MVKVLLTTATRRFLDLAPQCLEAISSLEAPIDIDWLIMGQQPGGGGDKTIAHKLNDARGVALPWGHDFMFNVEDDIVPPRNALVELLKAPGDVRLGVYHERPSRIPGGDWLVCQPWNDNPGARDHISRGEDFELHGSGGVGCALISKGVLEALSWPECEGFDVVWFRLLREKGFKVMVIPRVVCAHIDRSSR